MIKIVDNYKDANCITHSGNFHADEVFATAFLHLYKKDLKIFRVPEVDWDKVSDETLVYDIGRGEFDHHQSDAEVRENKIPYSSIGLVWKKFGRDYLEKCGFEDIEEIFIGVDKDLIEAIDGDDNGVFPKIDAPYKTKTVSNIVKLFNPGYASGEDESTQFLKVVEVAEKIIEEEIIYIKGKIKAEKKIKEILSNIDMNSKYLILDEFIPYEDTLLSIPNNILYVGYPSNRGGYAIKAVPVSNNDKTLRLPFPMEWAGLINEELEEVAGIKGLTFCHNSRFIMTCKSIDALKEVLDKLCK